jgi:hypothetical protein
MKTIFICFVLMIALFTKAEVFTVYSGGINGINLRYYISIASAGDTIYINNSLAGITLETDELLIDKPLSIFGTIHTQYIERSNVSGTPAFRIFRFINCGNVYLKNLEITGGLSPNINSVPSNGGAILVSDTNCYVHLENCIIRLNQASSGTIVSQPSLENLPGGGCGGAISNYGKITLKSCEINNNSAGKGGIAYYPIPPDPDGQCLGCPGGNGGAIINFGNTILLNCILIDNRAGNGGYFSDPFGYFSCSGDGGSGGAVFNSQNAELSITNCLFAQNSPGTSTLMFQGQGGAIYNSGNLNIWNSTLSKHTFLSEDNVNINPNIRGKSPTTTVVCSFGSSLSIANSILFNGSGGSVTDLILADTNSAIISYSLLGKINWNILEGDNNLLGLDPLFISSEDYHLSFNSPCINKGNPDGTNLTDTDLDGFSRVVESIVDMGAYEFQGFTETSAYHVGELNLFPNPSTGDININNAGLNIKEFLDVTISDLNGKRIFQQRFFHPDSILKINLPQRIDNGVYVIHINTENKTFMQKLIICR